MKLPSLTTLCKPSHWISPLRARQLQRAYSSLKLTLVCGLLTIVVLRGTLGAGSGKFGTPAKDFEEIRHQFEKVQLLSIHRTSGNTKHARRVLAEAAADKKLPSKAVIQQLVQSQHSPHDMNKNIAQDTTTLVQAMLIQNPTSTSAKMESESSNWDAHQLNQQAANLNIDGKRHKIMLVTGGSQRSACRQHCLHKSIKNKIDYCRIHDIEIFYHTAHPDEQMSGFSTKLPLLLTKVMLLNPHVDWFWWIDSDAMFTDMAFELPLEKYEDYNMVVHGWDDMVYEQQNWVGLNTGSLLMRNSEWSLDILDAWSQTRPVGTTDEVAKVSTGSSTGRLECELDDQCGLANLLVNERAKWADKVLLESSHYLPGCYWKFNDEEMMGLKGTQLHGVLGHEDWPFVTHFVGCKAFSRKTDQGGDTLCAEHMEGAFNFADSQAVQLLERYPSTSLSSSHRRLRQR